MGTARKAGWKASLNFILYTVEDLLKILECGNAATINVVIYQDEFDNSVQSRRKETQGKETVVVSQVWDGRAQTGIVARKKKIKEWISGMLKEDPTGLGYFKVREREKLKMSFELWDSDLPAKESWGDINSKEKVRKEGS